MILDECLGYCETVNSKWKYSYDQGLHVSKIRNVRNRYIESTEVKYNG